METPEVPAIDVPTGEEDVKVFPLAPAIESRFLFVDVAAMRAKQLRRGARVRLDSAQLASLRAIPHKPERMAIEEVRRNLVLYDTPDSRKAAELAAAAALAE